jgi:TonB family protein
MLVEKPSRVLLVCAAVTLVACAKPPDADVTAAREALESARTARADEYAPDSLRAAQEAQSALDIELQAQEAKWMKSYDRAKVLALAARTASDDASAAAVAARTKRDEEAAARERVAAAAAAAERIKASAVRVGGQLRPPVKTKNVQPIYPDIARSARVTGTVQLEATISADGKVVDARVVHSVPLLDQAALDAVRQWEYQPSLLNGRPVPVVVMVNVNFAQP